MIATVLLFAGLLVLSLGWPRLSLLDLHCLPHVVQDSIKGSRAIRPGLHAVSVELLRANEGLPVCG